MITFTLIAINTKTTQWWFNYRADDESYGPGEATLGINEGYTLTNVPAIGRLTVWKFPYFVDDIEYAGWKSVPVTSELITFEDGKTYSIDLVTGEIVEVFSLTTIITPIAQILMLGLVVYLGITITKSMRGV